MKRWCLTCKKHTEVNVCGGRIEDEAKGEYYLCPDELCGECGEAYD